MYGTGCNGCELGRSHFLYFPNDFEALFFDISDEFLNCGSFLLPDLRAAGGAERCAVSQLSAAIGADALGGCRRIDFVAASCTKSCVLSQLCSAMRTRSGGGSGGLRNFLTVDFRTTGCAKYGVVSDRRSTLRTNSCHDKSFPFVNLIEHCLFAKSCIARTFRLLPL